MVKAVYIMVSLMPQGRSGESDGADLQRVLKALRGRLFLLNKCPVLDVVKWRSK